MIRDFLNTSLFTPTLAGPGLREQIVTDILGKYGHVGDLVDIFASSHGEGIDKWHHYLPLYARYLAPWRGRPLRFLEIGVHRGGSLQMWRSYFGPQAKIFGIDIDPTCARYDGEAGQVRIGSQADAGFLARVVDEMGGIDVVLDDGSHQMAHVRTSLNELFPRLAIGGSYIIEDLHTAYWQQFGGGLSAPSNFFTTVRDIIDDMHQWYHDGAMAHAGTGRAVTGLHIHDSMVVIDKGATYRPVRSTVSDKTDKQDAKWRKAREGKTAP